MPCPQVLPCGGWALPERYPPVNPQGSGGPAAVRNTSQLAGFPELFKDGAQGNTLSKMFLFKKYLFVLLLLFIWLHQVLDVGWELLVATCGI